MAPGRVVSGRSRTRRHNGFRAHGRKGTTSPEQDALAAAALFVVLHIECERYDRAVCTGLPAADGSGVMPRTTTEMGITAAHAAQVGERLLDRAVALGIPGKVLTAAEAFVQRMPYGQVEADYVTALRIIGGPLSA